MSDEESKSYEERAKEFMNSHKNSSENDLMTELMQAIASSKQNGTFDKIQIEKFAKQIAPMMNAEQRGKLQGIIDLL